MDAQEFKYHVARLCWTPTYTAQQFGRSERTGYAWARGTRKIPQVVANFLETYADPMNKPKPKTRTVSEITPAHLKLFRKHFNLSQAQAAQLVHVSRVTWNRWEKEQSPIPDHLGLTLRGLVQQLKNEAET